VTYVHRILYTSQFFFHFHPPADFWWLTLGGLYRTRPPNDYHPPLHQRVLVTAAIVPAALFLRALQPTLSPPFPDRYRSRLRNARHPADPHPPTRTILYCYYNDTLLCLNIWVRILLKPYSLSALVCVCVVYVTSVCARWRRSPAELVKTLINIYYGKPTSRILFTRFLTSLRGFIYTGTVETRHFLLLYIYTHTLCRYLLYTYMVYVYIYTWDTIKNTFILRESRSAERYDAVIFIAILVISYYYIAVVCHFVIERLF